MPLRSRNARAVSGEASRTCRTASMQASIHREGWKFGFDHSGQARSASAMTRLPYHLRSFSVMNVYPFRICGSCDSWTPRKACSLAGSTLARTSSTRATLVMFCPAIAVPMFAITSTRDRCPLRLGHRVFIDQDRHPNGADDRRVERVVDRPDLDAVAALRLRDLGGVGPAHVDGVPVVVRIPDGPHEHVHARSEDGVVCHSQVECRLIPEILQPG